LTGDNKRKKNNIIKNSGILGFLFFVADWLYRKIGASIAAFLFTGYETCQKYYEKSMIYRLFQGYEPSIIKNPAGKFKKSIITKCETSPVINGIKKFADGILSASLSTIGTFFLSFGFYSALMYLLKIYILKKTDIMLLDLIAGIVLTVASILLIIFGKNSLYNAIYNSFICNLILFKFLGFPEKQCCRDTHKNTSGSLRKTNIICFFVGMILGILTYFMSSPVGSVAAVCVIIAGIGIFYAILCYPEAGFLLFMFAVPFLPPGNLVITGAGPCILISMCYFLKLIRGKRTFTFEIFDLFVLMFGALIFFSGAVSVSKTGSIKPALMYLCFTLIYFTAVNIIRLKEMIKRSVSAVVFSSFLVAVYGIYQNFFGVGDQTWQDSDMFSDIAGRVVSTLENPNVLAEYLILIIPFIIVSIFIANNAKTRVPSLIFIVCALMCLVYTWSRGSWLGFLLSSAVLFIIINKKAIVAYLGVLFLVPFAPLVLPENIIQRFTNIGNIADSSTSYRVSIWQASVNLIKDYIVEGIGIGREPFKLVYPGYSLAGIESAPHSHSLYLQVSVEFGVLGLIVLVCIIFFFMQYCFAAIKKTNEKCIKLYIAAGLCAGIGFLLNGFTDYVWYNYRVYLMFWLVISITIAVCRFGMKTKTTDKETDINTI